MAPPNTQATPIMS